MEPLRILHMHVEQFGRITVADVSPDPGATSTTVAGDNESGKSTLLNGISVLINGIGGHTVNGDKPGNLVRRGAESAKLSGDLGYPNGKKKYTVEREIEPDGKSRLVIRNASGKKIASTQAFLDDLSGHLGFDPSAFIEMAPERQFEELRRVAKVGPEMDALDAANARDYEERRELNGAAKRARAAAESVAVPENLPEQRIDIAKLLDAMKEVKRHNDAVDADKRARDDMAARAAKDREKSTTLLDNIAPEVAAIEKRRDVVVLDIEEQIDALKKKLQGARRAYENDVRETTSLYEHQAQLSRMNADALEKKLADMPAVAEPKSADALEAELESADEVNRGIESRSRLMSLEREASGAEAKSKELTAAMESRTKQKQDMLAGANLPIDGLGFGDKMITLHNVPFKNASDGEQWRTAALIAMAGEQEIRVVLVRRASLIGPKNLKVIEDVARERQYHLWLEYVDADPSQDGAIVMVEGTVRK